MSAKEAKKLNYVELENMLFDSGYINVEVVAEHDLVTGWLTKDGKVKSITINGNSSFGEGASFRPDDEVVIIYHTFKNR